MAYAGHRDRKEIEAEFDSATKTLKFCGFQLAEKRNQLLRSGLFLAKTGKAETIGQKTSPVEVEFLHTNLGVLDCPGRR